VRRVVALASLGLVLGCGGMRGPVLDPQEHVRGEHERLVHEPLERLWPAVLHALDEEGFGVARADRPHGTISTRAVRYAERDLPRKLSEIGDLSAVRAAGLRAISELVITYHLLLTPAGEADTRLRIRSTIDAVDRGEALFLGPGVFQVIPHHLDVPSRGVVERDLMRRMAASLFTAEEMLFLLGELGVD